MLIVMGSIPPLLTITIFIVLQKRHFFFFKKKLSTKSEDKRNRFCYYVSSCTFSVRKEIIKTDVEACVVCWGIGEPSGVFQK